MALLKEIQGSFSGDIGLFLRKYRALLCGDIGFFVRRYRAFFTETQGSSCEIQGFLAAFT